MRRKFLFGLILGQLIAIPLASASMFGEEDAILAQILVQSIQSLSQLKEILGSAQQNIQLVKDINRGINDSILMMKTSGPNAGSGVYNDWRNPSLGLSQLEQIYGTPAPQTYDTEVQANTDESVAEAVSMNNSMYDYSKNIDEMGEMIKEQSHNVSPGGAAKLTAESIGVMLHVQNESLRAQATGLKLQAQALAIQNRKDKEQTKQSSQMSQDLSNALSAQSPQFTLPRF